MRVSGVGPAPCRYMICGEGPGWEEDRAGLPFVGKTGKELDRYLATYDLPEREDIFLTNIFRQFRGKDYVWTQADRDECEPELAAELKRVRPELIITLGRYATRYFLGDVDMDDTHSMPWQTEQAVIFPVYHPAAGFHNPEIGSFVTYGFSQLADYFAGRLHARKLYDDPIPQPHYEEITTVARLGEVLRGFRQTDADGRAAPIAIDTEGYPGDPWSLQFSFERGRAFLISAMARDVLDAFGNFLALRKPLLAYHSALHDIGRMRELELPTDLDFDDTMEAAYLLQIEPQGLKPLCVRHCNMRMQSYDDVVGDAQQRIALDYMQGIWDIEEMEYEERCQDAFWADVEKGRRISKVPKLPKTALHKAAQRCLGSKDTYRLWHDQLDDIQVAGYRHLGPIPRATLDHVERDRAVAYGCRDSDGTLRLAPELSQRVSSLELRDVYRLDLATYPIIERMSYIGLKPDLKHFANLSEQLGVEILAIQERLTEKTGVDEFNANSGDQVSEYLFNTLGIEGIKWLSKSERYSTNDKILEALEHEHPEHPVISDIREYREVFKLKHTFCDRIGDFVRRWPHDGRVHATFRTTRVVTGRLASSDPNLLAQPKHGKFASAFRRGWVADEGHVFGSWDLSQIELRVLAHLSQDPVMLAIYRGERRNPDGSLIDLHAALAQRIFGGSAKDYAKGPQRLAAKAVNFGIPMGMTYKGLAVELRKNGVNASEDDAQQWLDETLSLYQGVKVYQDSMIAEAEKNGFIRCLSGRIRYIGGIRSRTEHVRQEAERFAFSTPIQEGAQWLMKQSEARLWNELIVPAHRRGDWLEPIIQIHDDLLLEFETKLTQDVNRGMLEIMTTAPKGFSVPVETSGDCGINWADMVPIR